MQCARCCRRRVGASAVPTVGCPFASLVALLTRRVLLLCAKHLFVATIDGSSTRHWEAGADLDIRLVLDRDARLERDARRKGGQVRASDYMRG